jgi:hypothetical protein
LVDGQEVLVTSNAEEAICYRISLGRKVNAKIIALVGTAIFQAVFVPRDTNGATIWARPNSWRWRRLRKKRTS